MPHSNIGRFLAAAIVTVSTLVCLGQSKPAHAASDYLLNMDGTVAKIDADNQAISDKLGALEALLSSIDDQLQQAATLGADIGALRAGVVQYRETDFQRQAEAQTEVDEAKRIFTDQVAALLDSDVVEAVSLNFQKIEMKFTARDEDADDDGIATILEDLMSRLDGAQKLIDETKGSAAAAKAGYDLKENKKV